MQEEGCYACLKNINARKSIMNRSKAGRTLLGMKTNILLIFDEAQSLMLDTSPAAG
jgi:hypothetical protein